MNDERPIEKLLRRAAKKRGDETGPPPELHPANRRLLQGEVARQFPKPGGAKQSALAEFWAGLTQRWVYAVGIFVVLAVAAIAILPMLSKPKSQLNLAQSAPGEGRLEMELAKNAPAALEQSVATPAMVMESDLPREMSLSAMPQPATAPPPTVAPATALVNRQISGRRDAPDTSATLADSMVANSAIQPPTRVSGDARLAVAGESTEASSRPTPASIPRAQPTRSISSDEFRGGRGGGGGGGNLALPSADARLKTEAQPVTSRTGVGQKEFDSIGTTTVAQSAAPAGAATGGFSDKAWLARGGGMERERAVLNSQAYSNVGLESQASKKAVEARKDLVPLSANFKIEQAGRDVRVVDGDGSIYKGVVDEENTLYKQMVDRQNQNLSNAYENKFKFQAPKTADAIGSAKQQIVDYYLYRVQGTNRTLNQNVVFTWNFVPTNEALAAAQLNYREALQKADATKLPSQLPALLQNSFINGRAQFGEGKQIEVNAVPVTP